MNRRSFLKNVAIGGAAATAISIPAVAQEKLWWRLAAMYPERAKAFAIMVADASDWRLNIEVLDAEAGSINPADIAACMSSKGFGQIRYKNKGGFQAPNTSIQMFKQPLMNDYTSYA